MGKGDLVPRIITNFEVKLRCGPHEVFAHADPVNLSETGLCLRLRCQMEADQPLELQIRLAQDSEAMEVPGRVVWLREDHLNKVYFYGVGFTQISRQLLKQIKDYVEIGGASLLEFFSDFPLFADFSCDDCRALLRIVTLRELKRKEVLYQEGARDADLQGLFIVQSGLLNIFKGIVFRPERQLAVVSAGQIFGEATLVHDQPHSASIIAVNDAQLIQINKMGFMLLRKQEPELALKIMEVVARALATRLGRTTKRLFSPLNLCAGPGRFSR